MTTDPRIQLIEHKTLCQGFFRLDRYRLRFQKFDGTWSQPVDREVFERGKAAALIPYDPIRDEVVLIEQFRPGALVAGRDPWLYEIVAGAIEEGESPQAVAHRETVEEAGLKIRFSEFICDYLVSPGCASEHCFVFAGCVDSSNPVHFAGVESEDEDIRVHVMPAAKAFQMLNDNRINNAVSIIGLQWLAARHQIIRADWLEKLKSGK